MLRWITNIYQLGIKELYSLRYDPVMLFLVFYMFSFTILEEAENAVTVSLMPQ